MRILIATAIFVLSQTAAQASTTKGLPPQFDAIKWQALVAQAAQSSDIMDSDYGQFRILTRITPLGEAGPRQADYFSAVGYPNGDGSFSASYVSAVSETWTIDGDGNWDINQWIYNVSLNGDLYYLSHNHLVETPDGAVLVYEDIPTKGPQDKNELAHWGVKLQEWQATELSRLH